MKYFPILIHKETNPLDPPYNTSLLFVVNDCGHFLLQLETWKSFPIQPHSFSKNKKQGGPNQHHSVVVKLLFVLLISLHFYKYNMLIIFHTFYTVKYIYRNSKSTSTFVRFLIICELSVLLQMSVKTSASEIIVFHIFKDNNYNSRTEKMRQHMNKTFPLFSEIK